MVSLSRAILGLRAIPSAGLCCCMATAQQVMTNPACSSLQSPHSNVVAPILCQRGRQRCRATACLPPANLRRRRCHWQQTCCFEFPCHAAQALLRQGSRRLPGVCLALQSKPCSRPPAAFGSCERIACSSTAKICSQPCTRLHQSMLAAKNVAVLQSKDVFLQAGFNKTFIADAALTQLLGEIDRQIQVVTCIRG